MRYVAHDTRIDSRLLRSETVHERGVTQQIDQSRNSLAMLIDGVTCRIIEQLRVVSACHRDAVADIGTGFLPIQRLQMIINDDALGELLACLDGARSRVVRPAPRG